MKIPEFVLVLQRLNKGVIPLDRLISGVLMEVHCESKHRRGLVERGWMTRTVERERRKYWR